MRPNRDNSPLESELGIGLGRRDRARAIAACALLTLSRPPISRERHGGWIFAQSEPGAGTTFTAVLPAKQAAKEIAR